MTYYHNPELVAAKAKAELPCKFTNVQQKARDYQEAVMKELNYSFYLLANMEQINNNQLPFNLTRVRQELGRYGKAPQKYWWDWLHTNFPIVKTIKKGNSYQKGVSIVEIDIPLDIVLASGDPDKIFSAIYSRYDKDSEVCIAKINQLSLKNYIASTDAQKSPNKTIQKNLKDARLILMISEFCNGVLPQIISKSNFGRTYYQGLNLQSVHKTVREAALGRGHSIDINTSVFNWKYAMVPFREELTYTRELIKDKTRTRKYLAKVVFGTSEKWAIDLIKKTITAISFGAKGESRSWFKNDDGKWTQGAISEIIRSKELRQKLFDDPWMIQFMIEQEKINKWIGDDLVAAVNEGAIPETYLEDLKSERGRISRVKLIAWAYQQSEQMVMKDIIKYSNAEVLLQVHDGVYFKTKPDINSMNTILQQHWPLASLSYEEIESYSYTNIIDIADHKKVIEKAERDANNGYLTPRTKLHADNVKQKNAHSEPNWEQQMKDEHSLLTEYSYPAHIQSILNR